MKIKTKFTRMTRQTEADGHNLLAALTPGGGHVSIDVVDPHGDVGHICVFKGIGGGYYARGKTPDPRCLYNKLKRSLRLDEITLAVRPADV